MDTIYSLINYERFHVANFIRKIIPAYEKSIENSEEINERFFEGMKS